MIKNIIRRLFMWVNPIQPIIWVKFSYSTDKAHCVQYTKELQKHVSKYGYMLITTLNTENTTDLVVFNANVETLGIEEIRKQVKELSEF